MLTLSVKLIAYTLSKESALFCHASPRAKDQYLFYRSKFTLAKQSTMWLLHVIDHVVASDKSESRFEFVIIGVIILIILCYYTNNFRKRYKK